MTPQTPVRLGAALDGVGWHPASWREDTVNAKRLADPEYWVELAQTAERGLLDFLTIDDTLGLQFENFGLPDDRVDRVRGRLDSVLIASRVAPRTRHIGLIPTAVVTHTEPFHLAKAIATLDFISAGRAGVRLKVDVAGTEVALFGRRDQPLLDPGEAGEAKLRGSLKTAMGEAADYGEVLHRLWDSWEDDAVIRDTTTGRFIDRKKLHHIDFEGEHFSVKGPLTVPRPPQGQPLTGVLAHVTEVYRLAADVADLVWFTPHSDNDIRGVCDELAGFGAHFDRGDPLVKFGDLLVALDSHQERGIDRLHRLDELSGAPLTSDARIFTGSPAELADLIEAWTAAGLEGVRLRPASNAVDLPLISDALAPELRRRGLRPESYSATTLRGHLGLDRPRSRYATPLEAS
ncbi:LLM class flavin-dependent oxidoreductase [Gordonia sp. KTR9]|uniref:LLM class flavin-dependent oxidoreductase n=1 Tax=Gordonia sp. KTR9 TaxID=337191 RepID=UPI00027DDE1C|nr:LLM class flavin-dependent oxidoreductase [Gordonia sp. KTR9]AFR47278.1 Coenzyme F420-dependent N5,N10-methylene tetrahydromethanopterin reductase-related flavin- dependent oxidoreductase [Gordonia sp. KTR9]